MSYFMESPIEGQRLEQKTDREVAYAQLWGVGLRPGMAAADIGCGTGAVTRVMAQISAGGAVTGIDASTARLAEARTIAAESGLAITFRDGSAYDLPLATGSVDFAWSRFLFEYLGRPRQALAEMRRITRPRGTVVVADLDGQLTQCFPLDPEVQACVQAGLAILSTGGFDPWVGRKLFHWFQAEGFAEVTVNVTPYQVYAGSLSERDWANWQAKLTTVMEHLIAHTGDRERWTWARAQFLAALRRPDVFYYSTLVSVRGIVP